MKLFETPIRWTGGLLALGAALLFLFIAGPFPLLRDDFVKIGALSLSVVILLLSTQPLAVKHPKTSAAWRGIFWLIDAGLLIAFLYATWWFFKFLISSRNALVFLNQDDYIVGAIGMLILVEIVRRSYGWAIPIIVAIFVIYPFFGHSFSVLGLQIDWLPDSLDLPWIFRFSGYTIEKIFTDLWYSSFGVFGSLLSIVITVVTAFIIFGAILEVTGGVTVLLRLATAATGRIRGGPAHSAIVASALFGSINGAPIANVTSTGVFTIPLIRSIGFSGAFAGGVEAAASTAGQFTPPVMATVAFLVAGNAGVPYTTVALAAVIPALLYYAVLFSSVYTEAVRLGIGPSKERVRLNLDDALQSLTVLAPVVAVVGFLLAGFTAGRAGFWAVVTAILSGLFVKIVFTLRGNHDAQLRLFPAQILGALIKGGNQSAQIIVLIGAIGIIIGVNNLTGLGLRFAAEVVQFSGGSIFIPFLLTMFAAIFLGMGLPTVAAYSIVTVVMGPTIETIGVPALSAYMFILYFAVLANITPPVAIASYAAAPLAKANPLATSMQAVRIALVGFLIPFIWIYYPSILLVVGFSWQEFIWILARMPLAIWLFSTALSGVEQRPLSLLERLARPVLAFATLFAPPAAQMACFVIGAGMVGRHYIGRSKAHHTP